MPHGISVDPQGNIWLTDVALHQAFRYKKNNFDQPDLVLGEKFVPGSDDKHFCKPTVSLFSCYLFEHHVQEYSMSSERENEFPINIDPKILF